MAKPDDGQPTEYLVASPAGAALVKALLWFIALVLLLWRGIPVHLTVAGDQGKPAIPLFMRGIEQQSQPQASRYELQTVTRPNGATYITRIDKVTGSVYVYSLDDTGKLTQISSQP